MPIKHHAGKRRIPFGDDPVAAPPERNRFRPIEDGHQRSRAELLHCGSHRIQPCGFAERFQKPLVGPARPAESSQLGKNDGEGKQGEYEQDSDYDEQYRIGEIGQLRKTHLQK